MNFKIANDINSPLFSKPFEPTNNPYIHSRNQPNSNARIHYIHLGKKETRMTFGDCATLLLICTIATAIFSLTTQYTIRFKFLKTISYGISILPISTALIEVLFYNTTTQNISTSSIAVAEKILGQSRTDPTDDAKFNLAVFSRQIKSVQEKDHAEFLAFLQPKFTEEPLFAFAYGEMYYNGWGLEKNRSIACKHYSSAAAQGLAEAQNALGYCTQYGIGVKKNQERAVELYRQAADQGLPLAQYRLGECYLNGFGVPKNLPVAFNWLKTAADQDNADAQSKVGWCYDKGFGVKENRDSAIEYYNKAAAKGDVLAQHRLGQFN